MNDTIAYLKINTFNWKVDVFRELDEKLASSNDEKLVPRTFWALKSAYVFYYKFLKFLFKKEGKKILLPREIIINAQKSGKINDGDIWLSYIDYMNVFYNTSNSEEKLAIQKFIVNKFRTAIYNACQQINNEERKKFLEQYMPTFKKHQEEEIHLADNIPVYDYKDLYISERSYNIIIDFFKLQKSLKNVWIHGSRAYGTNTGGSDLDLILDCNPEDFNKIYDDFKLLPIPYLPDCKNINTFEHLFFIKSVQNLGTKKIYCSDDFD